MGVESALELYNWSSLPLGCFSGGDKDITKRHSLMVKVWEILLAYNTTFLEDSFERNLCCVMAYQMGIIMKKLHLETAGYLVSGALVRDK